MNMDLNSLYEQHYDKLFTVAYRLTGSREDAEDVVQEAFLNACKAFHTFQGNSSLSTWLYRIVVNCSYRYMKKLKKLPVVDISARLNVSEKVFFEMIKSEESVEDIVMTNDMRETCLQLFLKCMPQKQKIAFVLKVLLGLTTEEVAAIMDISEGAVKTNVYRARLVMKDNIEDKCSYINPNNPCNCKNWVAYAIRNNKMSMIPKARMENTVNYEDIYRSEIDFLSKVVMLYGNSPERRPYGEFIDRMKGIISNHSLVLL
ncbi:MAG TPA: RNA polymerase sigma factor [Candidatus Nitrosocosmicus sp.]|nr:RNA polymerase sigma factor [Candidatus Nitrosocosmicus sp.]